jgi:hypothetical protein
MAAKNFLIMISNLSYLLRFDGAEVICTKVPSMALHFSYHAADRIVSTLRGRGFDECLVATSNGLAATTQAILDSSHIDGDEFTVKFNKAYYFAGRDPHGLPWGSRDQLEAKSMSRGAANEICLRLKRMGFKDAQVIDFADIENSLENELKRVWEFGSESSPDSIKVE